MKIRFISLASGSSGNCYYLGTENTAYSLMRVLEFVPLKITEGHKCDYGLNTCSIYYSRSCRSY